MGQFEMRQRWLKLLEDCWRKMVALQFLIGPLEPNAKNRGMTADLVHHLDGHLRTARSQLDEIARHYPRGAVGSFELGSLTYKYSGKQVSLISCGAQRHYRRTVGRNCNMFRSKSENYSVNTPQEQ